MKYLAIMFKKEWIENSRTHKLLSYLIYGCIFGVLGPLTAIMIPQIMASFLPKDFIDVIPDPTYLDSYSQFFKNFNQLGQIILVFLFNSTLTIELERGSLINLITKGLPKQAIVLAKFLVIGGIWTLSYVLGAMIQYAYTLYYFNNDGENKLIAYSGTWLYGLLLISLILLFSTLFRKNSGVLLGILAVIVLFIVLSFVKKVKNYNPMILVQRQEDILTGDFAVSSYLIIAGIVVLLIAISLYLATLIFKQIEL